MLGGLYPCSNLFCAPPDVVEAIYFVVLFCANVCNCLTAFASIYLILRRALRELPPRDPTACSGPVSVIVPCYLPNEQHIIVATVEHIVNRLEWPGRMTVYVVYNSPHALPEAEAALRALEGRAYAGGRSVRVIEAVGSKSKAETQSVSRRSWHEATRDEPWRPEGRRRT